MIFLGLKLGVISSSKSLISRGSWFGMSVVGIPFCPGPATARLSLLFLDSRKEQNPYASGRICLTMKEENSVCMLLCPKKRNFCELKVDLYSLGIEI